MRPAGQSVTAKMMMVVCALLCALLENCMKGNKEGAVLVFSAFSFSSLLQSTRLGLSVSLLRCYGSPSPPCVSV